MNDFCEQLYQEMMCKVNEVQYKGLSPIKEAEAAYEIVNKYMLRLKTHVLKEDFKDTESEISFFKQLKPKFVAKQIYYGESFYILNSLLDLEEGVPEIKQQLLVLKKHFKKHHFLYNYYRLEKSSLDRWLFLRNVEEIPFIIHRPFLHRDNRFETIGSYRFGKFMAYESLAATLKAELDKLTGPKDVRSSQNLLKWTGPKVHLVELIYALKVAGVFNNGQAELKELGRFLEQLLDTKVGDIYRIYQEIRIRKKGRTVFLDSLKEKLEAYMEQGEGLV
ncbi:RteC domain-containing protein [Echinicola sediminis]